MSAGVFRSALRLDDVRTEIAETTLLASAGTQLRPRLNLSVALGAVLDGSFEPEGSAAFDVEPGPALSVTLSWLALPETPARPFVFAGVTLGGMTAVVGGARATALDARATLLAGKTFGPVVLYAAGRVFGGPVFWRLAGSDVTGSDVHHFSLGAGARLALPASVDLFVEGMPLGEQSATLGLGVAL